MAGRDRLGFVRRGQIRGRSQTLWAALPMPRTRLISIRSLRAYPRCRHQPSQKDSRRVNACGYAVRVAMVPNPVQLAELASILPHPCHVCFPSHSDHSAGIGDRQLRANTGREQLQQRTNYSITSASASKNGSPATNRASARSRSRVPKAASISPPLLALSARICNPMARAASPISCNVASADDALAGLTSTPTRTALGANSWSSASRLAAIS